MKYHAAHARIGCRIITDGRTVTKAFPARRVIILKKNKKVSYQRRILAASLS